MIHSGTTSLSRILPIPSPLFGACSPSSDSGDMSSDDGDSLHTPLTEHHDHRLHSCDICDQAHFLHDAYHSILPHHSSDSYFDSAKPRYGSSAHQHQGRSPYRSSPSDIEDSHDSIFSDLSPSSACPLSLPDASRETTCFPSPTYAPRTLDPTASPFTPTRQTLRPISPAFSAPSLICPDASPPGSKLSSLPSLTLTNIGCDDSDDPPSLLLSPARGHDDTVPSFAPQDNLNEDSLLCKGRLYSTRFHPDHVLNPFFVQHYHLEDELGAGGYGFVMTARHRVEGHEVAVKFIVKDKVPEHAWWEDEVFGRVPTEVMLLSLVNHENIVRCLDLFEDEVYFYLVQELHGTPWVSKKHRKGKQASAPGKLTAPTPLTTPILSPSSSIASTLDSEGPRTPPQLSGHGHDVNLFLDDRGDFGEELLTLPQDPHPKFTRRASHDLFECIEQSKHKRLSENQARYVFAQVVEAVYHLDSQGITHCDIKDENIVIDSDLKVKLIDFGSAVVADPTQSRPTYHLFFGTTAYASSEILLKKPYKAPPAEIWTLGVLLSYLLTGHSPFPTEQDAKDGHAVIREPKSGRLSKSAISLMARCLEKDPDQRATILEVRNHPWLRGALESRGRD